jgi:hypothetical protein
LVVEGASMCFLMTCDVCRLESGGDCGPLVAEALFGVPGRALCRGNDGEVAA